MRSRRSRHGGDVDLEELLAQQDGRCYLCGAELSPGPRNAVNVDHDHGHCPPRKLCAICRRAAHRHEPHRRLLA
jgi:hypothetical protein